MPDSIPESGDVVIHSSASNAAPPYAIYAVPGPDQFGCATRGEAERMARSCARRSGVNLWFLEGRSGFTLLARFRGAARGTTPANNPHPGVAMPGTEPQSLLTVTNAARSTIGRR
jgi:hypothetical protein